MDIWETWLATLAVRPDGRAQGNGRWVQGRMVGRLTVVCQAWLDSAGLTALAEAIVKISEIKQETLNVAPVCLSIVRCLAVDIDALAPLDR